MGNPIAINVDNLPATHEVKNRDLLLVYNGKEIPYHFLNRVWEAVCHMIHEKKYRSITVTMEEK